MNRLIVIILMGVFAWACSERQNSTNEAVVESQDKYTCPMHPSVVQDRPGNCPICGMELVKQHTTMTNNMDLMLTSTQMKLANITTQPVRKKNIGQVIPVNARLVINEELTEVISARIEGRIEKLFQREPGKRIMNGEPIYELYSEKLLTLQKEYLLAKEQFEKLGKQETRYESFMKAAQKKLLLYGLKQEQVDKLRSVADVQSRITFYSPVSGILDEINVVEGQYVNEGDKLYKIENMSRLWLEADLYAEEARMVKRGGKVLVRISGFDTEPAEATVEFINPEVRANTQISVMRASLLNKDLKWRPGQSAQLMLQPESKMALTVPLDAVIRDANGTHVYVLTSENAFSPRFVKTGIENFDSVEITEGLKEGDVIAATGAYLIYSEIILKKGVHPSSAGAAHVH
jgi:membrane fusion protein, copper/silver efflux system